MPAARWALAGALKPQWAGAWRAFGVTGATREDQAGAGGRG